MSDRLKLWFTLLVEPEPASTLEVASSSQLESVPATPPRSNVCAASIPVLDTPVFSRIPVGNPGALKVIAASSVGPKRIRKA